MPLPNFLIIRAAKSGTTSLYEYLKQHRQIFMSPVKEPGYFVYSVDRAQTWPRPSFAVADLPAYLAQAATLAERRA